MEHLKQLSYEWNEFWSSDFGTTSSTLVRLVSFHQYCRMLFFLSVFCYKNVKYAYDAILGIKGRWSWMHACFRVKNCLAAEILCVIMREKLHARFFLSASCSHSSFPQTLKNIQIEYISNCFTFCNKFPRNNAFTEILEHCLDSWLL